MNRPPPCAEILSQGDEIVCGEIADSNSAWLSRQLVESGLPVTRHTAVGDRLKDLTSVLKEIAERAACCICTGGLGPTRDDLTAEAVSLAFDLPLKLDPAALLMIEERFRQRKQTMPETNRKQALLPQGAKRLDNHWGTAPGFYLEAGGCHFYFLPGVPREMEAMYRQYVAGQLPQLFALRRRQRVVIHVEGMGESKIEALLATLALPPEVRLGFHAMPEKIRLKLTFPSEYKASKREAIVSEICRRLDKTVTEVERIAVGAQDESE